MSKWDCSGCTVQVRIEAVDTVEAGRLLAIVKDLHRPHCDAVRQAAAEACEERWAAVADAMEVGG